MSKKRFIEVTIYLPSDKIPEEKFSFIIKKIREIFPFVLKMKFEEIIIKKYSGYAKENIHSYSELWHSEKCPKKLRWI